MLYENFDSSIVYSNKEKQNAKSIRSVIHFGLLDAFIIDVIDAKSKELIS